MKLLIALLSFVLFGCQTAKTNPSNNTETKPLTENEKISGYNLTKPDFVFVLPDTLREVSGLTDLDEETIACVQDENGIFFIYDIVKNKIIKQITFSKDGDYEGITRVGKTMYILRSDGQLFEISNYEKPDFKLQSYATGVPANDNEGLCYDPISNQLLIASKSKTGKGKEYKNKRVIYGFDLKTKLLTEEPVYDFDLELIKEFATKHNIDLPRKTNENDGEITTEPFIKFKSSAISIHPETKKLYLLSASDHLFFIFDRNGEVEYIEYLDTDVFNKAEGITFLDNNDMIITNEGQDGKPTLLRFKYLK